MTSVSSASTHITPVTEAVAMAHAANARRACGRVTRRPDAEHRGLLVLIHHVHCGGVTAQIRSQPGGELLRR